MLKVSVFDFDGTLVLGDSIKNSFRFIYKSKIGFIVNYYLFVGHLYLYGLFASDYEPLRKARQTVLVKNFEQLNSQRFGYPMYQEFNDLVYKAFLENIKLGRNVLIVSAGYKEIIESIIDNKNVKVIAVSVFEKFSLPINGSHKVEMIKEYIEIGTKIKEAYGNTKGDVPMLKLAEKAFWVDENGKISKFIT